MDCKTMAFGSPRILGPPQEDPIFILILQSTDYSLYGSLRNYLIGKNFCNNDDLKSHLVEFFADKDQKLYELGIMKLPEKWQQNSMDRSTRWFGLCMMSVVLVGSVLSQEPPNNGDRFNSCQAIYSQFGLAIHQNDHQARRRFVEWAQNEIAVVPDFHKRILFSDEAHFWLNGYVNKQNCRIWREANPQVYVGTPSHPEKLTVWGALWAGGIIGPYFFKNDEGHNVTVNGDRYRAMITNFSFLN
ncbi:hypothetical protein TNCV_1737391 [Trichonephila clavipes]|nr:hypothetical protein TNCV_1737391 [Trichonephila clavipes]